MSSDGFVIIAPDNTGKRIDNGVVTRSGVDYLRQRVEVPAGVALTAGTEVIGKVEITDGGDVALGATTDAAVSTDTTGTVSGKLRGLVKILSNVWDSVNGRLKVIGPLTDAELRAEPIITYSHPIEYEVQHRGAINGSAAKLYHIMGGRSQGWNSTTAIGDGCDYLDTSQKLMNTPTVGQTLYLVSTSAQDDPVPLGTGAHTIRTVYLDAAGLEQVRTDTLNGTTPVSIGAGYTAIQWMEVASVGTGETSAGNIAISSTNGAATTATTFEFIRAGGNRSLSGRYTIPSDCHGHLIHWDAAAISNSMDVRIRATVFADDGALSTVYHFIDRVFLASGQNATQHLEYREIPAGAVVKMSAIPGAAAAGNKLDCSFSLICMAGAG